MVGVCGGGSKAPGVCLFDGVKVPGTAPPRSQDENEAEAAWRHTLKRQCGVTCEPLTYYCPWATRHTSLSKL